MVPTHDGAPGADSTATAGDRDATETASHTGSAALTSTGAQAAAAARRTAGMLAAWWNRAAEAISGRGVMVLGLALAGLVLGAAMVWTELLALGLAATVLLLLALPFTVGSGRHRVEVDLSASRVVVGDPAWAHIRVTNPTTHALAGATVEMPVGREVAVFGVPRLSAGAGVGEELPLPTARRSVLELGPARTVRGDPVGLFRRVQQWGGQQTFYVHPRTIPLDRVTTGVLRDLDGVVANQLATDDVAFHALRPYVRGDDRRAVHWRSTARTGTLMVRQYEETRRWHLAIGLSTAAGDYADGEEFETAVSVAGSLGVTALTDARSLTVLTQRRGLRTGSGRMLLDQLSGIDTAPTTRDVVQLAVDISVEAPQASLVVLVAGSTVDVARLKTAHSRIPIGTACVAVRIRPDESPTRGRLGDLQVISLATLADLPRALRGALS